MSLHLLRLWAITRCLREISKKKNPLKYCIKSNKWWKGLQCFVGLETFVTVLFIQSLTIWAISEGVESAQAWPNRKGFQKAKDILFVKYLFIFLHILALWLTFRLTLATSLSTCMSMWASVSVHLCARAFRTYKLHPSDCHSQCPCDTASRYSCMCVCVCVKRQSPGLC